MSNNTNTAAASEAPKMKQPFKTGFGGVYGDSHLHSNFPRHPIEFSKNLDPGKIINTYPSITYMSHLADCLNINNGDVMSHVPFFCLEHEDFDIPFLTIQAYHLAKLSNGAYGWNPSYSRSDFDSSAEEYLLKATIPTAVLKSSSWFENIMAEMHLEVTKKIGGYAYNEKRAKAKLESFLDEADYKFGFSQKNPIEVILLLLSNVNGAKIYCLTFAAVGKAVNIYLSVDDSEKIYFHKSK